MTASRGFVASIFLCLTACGGGSGDTGGGPSANDVYFPLPAGARWIYRHDDGSTLRIDALGAATTAQGPGTQLVAQDAAGNVVDQTIAYSSSSGVTVYPSDSVAEYGTDIGALKLLAFPAEAGQSFTQLEKSFTTPYDLDADGVREAGTLHSTVTVVGYEGVDTAAGHFADALHVRTDLHQTIVTTRTHQTLSFRSVVDDWYAPGVGLAHSVEVDYVDGVTPEPAATTDLAAYRVGALRSERVAPAVSSTAPGADARASTADVSVTFSEPVDEATLAAGWRIVDAGGQLLSGHVTMVGNTAHFVPVDAWHNGTYTSTLTTAVTDLIGNPIAQDTAWSFALDGVAPTVISTTPADGTSDLPTTAPIVVQFSEPIDPASVNPNTVWLSDDVNAVGVHYQVSGATLTVTPELPWLRQKTLTLSIQSVADVAGNPMTAGIVAHLRTDAGAFDYPVDLTAPAGTQAVRIVDLDGDGLNDFVYTPAWGSGGTVFVRYGQPDGTLAQAVPLVADDTSTCRQNVLIVADLDHDGLNDVVVGGTWCNYHLLRQTAHRAFVVGESIDFSAQAALRVADIDGDGQLDLVDLQNTDAMRLFVWHQDAQHRFSAPPVSSVLPITEGSGLAIADLDGDGRADLVISGTSFVNEDLLLLRQQADGRFVQTQVLATGESNPADVAVADVDSDGRPDIVATAGGNQPVYVAVFHQQADHAFGAPEHLPCLDIPSAVAVADIDGDGRPDVVVTHSGWGHVGTFLQRADGTLGPESLYLTAYGSGDAAQLAVGDLTGDGRVDLVVDGQILRQRTPDSGPASASARRVPGLAHAVRVPHRPVAAPPRGIAAARPVGAPQ